MILGRPSVDILLLEATKRWILADGDDFSVVCFFGQTVDELELELVTSKRE